MIHERKRRCPKYDYCYEWVFFLFLFFHVYFSFIKCKLPPNTCSRARHYNRELVCCGSFVHIVWSSGLSHCARDENTMHTIHSVYSGICFCEAKTDAVHWYPILYLLSWSNVQWEKLRVILKNGLVLSFIWQMFLQSHWFNNNEKQILNLIKKTKNKQTNTKTK